MVIWFFSYFSHNGVFSIRSWTYTENTSIKGCLNSCNTVTIFLPHISNINSSLFILIGINQFILLYKYNYPSAMFACQFFITHQLNFGVKVNPAHLFFYVLHDTTSSERVGEWVNEWVSKRVREWYLFGLSHYLDGKVQGKSFHKMNSVLEIWIAIIIYLAVVQLCSSNFFSFGHQCLLAIQKM